MAAADYYLCDSCGCKTFYDAALSYGESQELRTNPQTGHPWPDGDVGDMAVLCRKCSRTHHIVIEPRAAEAERKGE